jgi:serine protease Do
MRLRNTILIRSTRVVITLCLITTGYYLLAVGNNGDYAKVLAANDSFKANRSVPADSQLFVQLAEKLKPVTVNISTTKTMKRSQVPFQNPQPFFRDDQLREFFGDDFFERFFRQLPKGNQKLKSLGSGFIIDKKGYIITNNHVIEGADEIQVRLSDKEEYDAEIIGSDPKTDVALIKIDPKDDLPVAPLGNSDELKVGEWVMAIGNPFGLEQTVTAGVVSAKWRKLGMGPYEDFIQTDAAINQGNSGGPLFNTGGEVVGVNTVIYSTTGGNIGIGFAIPINLAKNVVEQLKEQGKVVRGWLGVVVQTVTPELAESFGLDERKGALVAEVQENSPADKAGFKNGDIILTFDGKEIEEMNKLPLLVAQTPVGKKVKVTIFRDGERITKKFEIGELKEDKTYALAREKSETPLGIEVSEITPSLAQRYRISGKQGVIVTYIARGSPAEMAGVREGDVIVEINREPVVNIDEYNERIEEAEKEDQILLLIERERGSLFLVVPLDK